MLCRFAGVGGGLRERRLVQHHGHGMRAEAYTKMNRALLATGRPMVFSMCEWGDSQPWNWGAPIANLWRTTEIVKTAGIAGGRQ